MWASYNCTKKAAPDQQAAIRACGYQTEKCWIPLAVLLSGFESLVPRQQVVNHYTVCHMPYNLHCGFRSNSFRPDSRVAYNDEAAARDPIISMASMQRFAIPSALAAARVNPLLSCLAYQR